MGIEPTLEAWEAAVLPLNYTRLRPPLGWFEQSEVYYQTLQYNAQPLAAGIDRCQLTPAHTGER